MNELKVHDYDSLKRAKKKLQRKIREKELRFKSGLETIKDQWEEPGRLLAYRVTDTVTVPKTPANTLIMNGLTGVFDLAFTLITKQDMSRKKKRPFWYDLAKRALVIGFFAFAKKKKFLHKIQDPINQLSKPGRTIEPV